ncbi:MAG: hypothetical protein OEU56_22290, partial [Rhodospirillales bacterium]|nr:hypothetical protein [Rhodospirillales bacterium]
MTDDTGILTSPHTALRVGGWLPTDPGAIRAYVADLIAEVEAHPTALLPPVQEFADVIDQNSII